MKLFASLTLIATLASAAWNRLEANNAAQYSTLSFARQFQHGTLATSAQEIASADTGGFVVADNGSPGTVRGEFTFDEGLTQLSVKLESMDLIGNVTLTHIHCGAPGTNGPVSLDIGAADIEFEDGELEGVFTNDAINPAAGCGDSIGFDIINIATLQQAMLRRRIYLNIHTDAIPSGEVRGQTHPQIFDEE
eukprot:CAMPEP_0185281500 /NCGR_PEP_ID=MMETSP1359-20130426/66757_1 /TAXON_ID=552665 /ORGANISM="Bigelowiella longifila, Strain CCMP242" /LENGTH=191 /DNA_ID=CAMNT_0027876947 /DNA_START=156 /DNA_END=731 /DNA_ORIENTATION=+